jgi:hypothetical protein
MKGTEHFKRTIQAFLEQRTAEDELFAVNYHNPTKNIDDCITYILNYVQKSGCNGFSDDEIFGQVIHFYPKYIVIKSCSCQILIINNLDSIVFRIALDNISLISGSLLLKFPLFLGLFTTFAKNTIG